MDLPETSGDPTVVLSPSAHIRTWSKVTLLPTSSSRRGTRIMEFGVALNCRPPTLTIAYMDNSRFARLMISGGREKQPSICTRSGIPCQAWGSGRPDGLIVVRPHVGQGIFSARREVRQHLR